MLSPNDLNDIRQIVNEVVQASEGRLKSELVSKQEFNKEIRKIWKELRYLRKTANLIIEHFETEIFKVKQRIAQI